MPSNGAAPPEDEAVARVEQILDASADRLPWTGQAVRARVCADQALWICACVTGGESPTWLIQDSDEAGLVWTRVPDGVAVDRLLDARATAGGHADPREVLLWLQGKASDPWASGGGGWGDAGVVEDLAAKVRRG